MIYDFAWDDGGDLGVWVAYDDGREILVEACVREPSERDENGEPTGEYLLASAIEMQPGDSVITREGARLTGMAARGYVAELAEIQRDGKQIPVNKTQAAALGVKWED